MRYAALSPLPFLIAISSLLAFGAVTDVPSGAAPPTTIAVQDTLVGTVRSVNYQTNTVEILTGVGLAIHVEHVHVQASTSVTMEGESRPLADLRRGQVVQVAYQETDAGKVATSLEVVES